MTMAIRCAGQFRKSRNPNAFAVVLAGALAWWTGAACHAQVTGDFNGDGFVDLAIGVPNEDISGEDDAGAVHVIYGADAGLHANTTPDQFWHENSEDVLEACDEQDFFGRALAVGDFNGDDFDDLAIGVPGEEVDSDDAAGIVIVLYGSEDGLAAADSQLWSQDSDGIVEGAESDDQFGASLAAGDFDGDGFDDLAVGVPGQSFDADLNAGAVSIIYGAGNGLSAAGDQTFNQSTDGIADTDESDDHFGQILAAGDFDGDGNDDLAIGVPDEELDDNDNAGAVHVLYGAGGGLTAEGSQFWNQDTNGITDDIEEDESFGTALATGDFDGDGFADLAIGVPEEDVGPDTDAGAVHVLYGRDVGLKASGSQFFTQDTQDVVDSSEPNDRFGQALAAGNFDGDDFDDLAIGASGESLGGAPQCGAVIVLEGSGGNLTATGSRIWHQNREDILDECEDQDHFGTTLAAGDFNNDSLEDLAIAIPGEDVGTIDDAGAVHVLRGGSNGLRSGGNQFWNQDAGGILDHAEEGDSFGAANSQ